MSVYRVKYIKLGPKSVRFNVSGYSVFSKTKYRATEKVSPAKYPLNVAIHADMIHSDAGKEQTHGHKSWAENGGRELFFSISTIPRLCTSRLYVYISVVFIYISSLSVGIVVNGIGPKLLSCVDGFSKFAVI